METTDRQRRVRRQYWVKLLTFLGLLFAVIVALLAIDNLLVSFVIAIIISYLVSPLVSYLEGTGMGRIPSILVVYCLFTTGTGVAIWALTPFLVDQLSALNTRLPEYVDGTVNLFENIRQTLDLNTGGLVQLDIGDRLREWLTQQSSILFVGLPSVLSSSFAVLFLSPLLGFFILKDGQAMARTLLRLVPNDIFELTLSLQHQIGQQIGSYIRARLIESLIVGGVCFIGFLVIGFPFAFLLAAFAGVANLIPYIGPLFGAAPGIVLALINQSPSVVLLLVALVYLIAQLIDNLIIIPLVVARLVNLHPVTVILSVLLGAQVLGILGMLISIPVASTLKVTFQSIYKHLTA